MAAADTSNTVTSTLAVMGVPKPVYDNDAVLVIVLLAGAIAAAFCMPVKASNAVITLPNIIFFIFHSLFSSN